MPSVGSISRSITWRSVGPGSVVQTGRSVTQRSTTGGPSLQFHQGGGHDRALVAGDRPTGGRFGQGDDHPDATTPDVIGCRTDGMGPVGVHGVGPGLERIEPHRAARAQGQDRELVPLGQVEVLALRVEDGHPLAGHGLAVEVGLHEGGLAVALVARDQHARGEQCLGRVQAERVVTEHPLAEDLLADDRPDQRQSGLALEGVGGGRVPRGDRHGREPEH